MWSNAQELPRGLPSGFIFLIMKYLLLIIITFVMICIYLATQSKEYSTTIIVDSCEYIVTHSKDCKFCKMRQ